MRYSDLRAQHISNHTREHGPARACEMYGLRLPELVHCVTGIPTKGSLGSLEVAMQCTMNAEEQYRESGLAAVQFPTYLHTRLTFLTIQTKGSPEYVQVTRDAEDRPEEVFYKSHFTYSEDAVLVSQWREDDIVHEIYTAGGTGTNGKDWHPRCYFSYSFDAESGDLLTAKTLPFQAKGPMGWLQAIAHMSTLTMSTLLIDAISVPLKNSLEKRLLEQAQKEWSLHRGNIRPCLNPSRT